MSEVPTRPVFPLLKFFHLYGQQLNSQVALVTFGFNSFRTFYGKGQLAINIYIPIYSNISISRLGFKGSDGGSITIAECQSRSQQTVHF